MRSVEMRSEDERVSVGRVEEGDARAVCASVDQE